MEDIEEEIVRSLHPHLPCITFQRAPYSAASPKVAVARVSACTSSESNSSGTSKTSHEQRRRYLRVNARTSCSHITSFRHLSIRAQIEQARRCLSSQTPKPRQIRPRLCYRDQLAAPKQTPLPHGDHRAGRRLCHRPQQELRERRRGVLQFLTTQGALPSVARLTR